MKIKLITIGREEEQAFESLFQRYVKRLSHYNTFEPIHIKPLKSATSSEQVKADAALLLKKVTAQDTLILLDEKGKEMNSEEFAAFMMSKLNTSTRTLIFAIGGAYGFDQTVYERSNGLLSLSRFTFPHQLAKVVFAEQLYRAFTLIRNEKYHHGNR